MRALCNHAGPLTLKARIRILGEAAQRCLGVEHVRVFITTTGSRELSVLYTSHPDNRAVPLASGGALAAAGRGKGQTWHGATGVTQSHGVSAEVQHHTFTPEVDAPHGLACLSAMHLPIEGEARAVLGVLQLLNRQRDGGPTEFAEADQQVAAAFAALAGTNRLL